MITTIAIAFIRSGEVAKLDSIAPQYPHVTILKYVLILSFGIK